MIDPTTADGPAPPGGEASAAPSMRDGPGRLVRAARERAGWTLDDLAAQTRLAHETLEAIESDDFSVLKESVYVRGYYRKCAKVLKLPESELITAYERLALPKTTAAPSNLLLSGEESGRRLKFVPGRWMVIAATLAVLAAIVVLVSGRNDTSKTLLTTLEGSMPASSTSAPAGTTSTAESAPASVAASPVPSAPAPEPSAASLPAAVPSSPTAPAAAAPAPQNPAQTGGTMVSTPAPASAAVAAKPLPAARPVVSSAPKADTTSLSPTEPLVLELRQRSWVEVQDATGRKLIDGMVRAGAKTTLVGHPPFSIFLGNAPAVDVQYQGASVKINSYIRSNATARFSVPISH